MQSKDINQENLEIKPEFLVETCGRFPKAMMFGCAGLDKLRRFDNRNF